MDWQYLQSSIYGCLHWTPDVFWNLSMLEYIAAIRGIILINKATSEGSNQPKKGHLSKQDISHLRGLLEKDKENNG